MCVMCVCGGGGRRVSIAHRTQHPMEEGREGGRILTTVLPLGQVKGRDAHGGLVPRGVVALERFDPLHACSCVCVRMRGLGGREG